MVTDPLVRLKAILSRLKHTTQINWAMNNTRPDSINIEMRGVKSCIPRACVFRRAREALAILNTSRPVNMAFTARDREKDSMPTGLNQPGRFSEKCGPRKANSPTSDNDAASSWVSKYSIWSNFRSTYPGMLVQGWKERLRRPVFGSIPPNSGISEWEWDENPGFFLKFTTYQNPLSSDINERINCTGT